MQDPMKIGPLPWQRWLLIHGLELLPSGRFRFRTILVLAARQNGKTLVLQGKNLWKMYVLQVRLVIGTAQDLDTAEEVWDAAVELVESNPELDAEKAGVDRTNGKKALKLVNGSRWKVVSTSRRGGRGKAGDDVNLDELREHLDWLAWGAVTKTTMARPTAQIWGFSNAGDDRSVVLNDLQAKGRGAAEMPELADPQLGYFEWSAPDDVRCTCVGKPPDAPHAAGCRLRDRLAWAQANPALGYTITVEALESALSTDPEAVFRTECLCQRVPSLVAGIISPAQWKALLDPTSMRVGDVAIGADVDPLREFGSVAVFGLRADGLGHGHLVDYRPGVDWLPGRLAELREALNPIGLALGRGTYESLRDDLADVGLSVPEVPEEPCRGDVAVMTPMTMAAACGQMIDAVKQCSLRVRPSKPLDDAAAVGQVRQGADTVAWSPRVSGGQIGPIVSLTLARWLHGAWGELVGEADYDILASFY
jgi:hypothetical protein